MVLIVYSIELGVQVTIHSRVLMCKFFCLFLKKQRENAFGREFERECEEFSDFNKLGEEYNRLL